MDGELITRSSSYASSQAASEQGNGSLGIFKRNSGANNEQAVRNSFRSRRPANEPAQPQLRSRAENASAFLTDESQSENISRKEERTRQVKTRIGKQLSDPQTHFDPYRSPPAVPLRFSSKPARALPSQP